MSAEVSPWSRKGGLGEAVSGLSIAMAGTDVPTTILTPSYDHVSGLHAAKTHTGRAVSHISTAASTHRSITDNNRTITFVQLPYPHHFTDVHTDTKSIHREGLDVRYVAFGEVVARELAARGPTGVCLTHDWHGAAVHLFRHICPDWQFIHVIHNYEYQGPFAWGPGARGVLGGTERVAREILGTHSPSLGSVGIRASQRVVTVSRGYARELESRRAPHAAMSALDGIALTAITNGYNSTEWNPATNQHLVSRFQGPGVDRRANAKHLQRIHGLSGRPIAAWVSRLTEQKGVDLLTGSPPSPNGAVRSIGKILEAGFDLVMTGEPDGGRGGRINEALRRVAAGHHGRFVYIEGFRPGDAHQIVAGSDVLLHPSRFEPCGLMQLQALAYGSLPIVNPVGGLRETVGDNLDPSRGPVGLHMEQMSSDGVVRALQRAGRAIADAPLWDRTVRAAMRQPSDWSSAVPHYLSLINELGRSR